MRNIFCCFFNQFFLLLLPSLLNRLVRAIDPEQLKPCFERYDGHKLFGAVPIHSEWRMKREEECLPFCIKASSRCSSIVYDKYEHTCYYFSVNGIEIESIERNSRMVYLQVAERRCVDEMLMVMESEDSPVQQQIHSHTQHIDSRQRYSATKNTHLQHANPAEFGKINYGKVRAQIEVPLHTFPMTESSSSQLSSTSASSSSPPASSFESSLPPTLSSSPLSAIASTVTNPINEPHDRNNDKNGYLALYETAASPPTSMTATVPPIYPKTVNNVDKLAWQKTFSSVVSSLDSENQNIQANQLMNSLGMNSAVDSIPSLLPVISRFKAVQRRPATTFSSNEKIEEKVDFQVSNDIRRHPQNKENSETADVIPTTVLPITLTTTTELSLYENENNFNQDSIPESKNSAYIIPTEVGRKASIPKVENLPSLTSDEVEYEDQISSSEQEEETRSCRNSENNEIWLAVESAKLKSSLTNKKGAAASYDALPKTPRDCINACKTRRIRSRKRLCDSFTFFETTKQCVFDSTDKWFMEKMIQPEQRADFTTRVFRRLCFPSNMTPFKSCAEFLAFRTYSLAIPAREFFNGLPTGVDGISACIELCVLSSDFQCRSALFDAAEGICQLFDEHSLSSPLSFKEHSRSNQLYFENGCLDGGEVPQEPSLTSNMQQVHSRQEPPTRIYFNKILQKH